MVKKIPPDSNSHHIFTPRIKVNTIEIINEHIWIGPPDMLSSQNDILNKFIMHLKQLFVKIDTISFSFYKFSSQKQAALKCTHTQDKK